MERHLAPLVSRWVVSAAALFAVGCSSEPEVRTLGPDQFSRPTDRGGALPPGPAPTPTRVGLDNDTEEKAQKVNAAAAADPSGDQLKFVAAQVKNPNPVSEPATAPSTAAAPRPMTYEPGQYISVGGVIAEVNGAPLYADAVLRTVSPLLAARAKSLEEQEFRNLATTEIARQVDELIRAEVEYAAADRNTTAEEKQTADRITQQWRDKLKTDSKGSMEEVRKHFREQGRTYEEAAKDQYRLNLVRVYYSKKLFPRIQVTADDMRRYYDKNRESAFTERDNITFRLIKISEAGLGSDAAAKQKIDDIAARVQRGEDFETLAGQFNNDPLLLRNKGLTGPIDRGAYVLDQVEAALWKLEVGQTTPVLHEGSAYFIARLEAKKLGRTLAFEEDVVQQKMLDVLRGEQFTRMRRDMEMQLRKDSVVAKNDAMYDAAVTMAMQNYPRWHG